MDAAQQFTGQVRDQEAGQGYFNARYFTPPQGRFNSADPGNAGADFTSSQSWNGYGYVLGNPLNGVDPSGARWVTFQVQVCTPSISSTIVYYTLPSGSSNGTTSACHSVPMEIWVDDNPPVISIGGGSGPGGGGGSGGSGGGTGSSTQVPPKNVKPLDDCTGLPDIEKFKNAAVTAIGAYPKDQFPIPWLRGIAIHFTFTQIVSTFNNTSVNVPYKNRGVAGWFDLGSVRPDAYTGM